MSDVLSRSVLEFAIDDSQFRPGMDRVQGRFDKFRDSAKRGSEDLGTFSGSLKSATSLAEAFGVSLSLAGLVAFGKDLLDTGDRIVKTADQTGLLYSEVQRLDYIAGQSGNTIEQITSAIGQMQKRLASGEAAAGVEALHLNFEKLRNASPYEQLEQISVGFAGVKDPAERARLAMELFGKSGIEILPTLIANVRELGAAAPVMSDETVAALDKAGDEWHSFTQHVKVWTAESYTYAGHLFDLLVASIYNQLAKVTEAYATATEQLARFHLVPKSVGDSAKDMREWSQWFKDAANGLTDAGQAAAAATSRATGNLAAAAPAAKSYADQLKAARAEIAHLSDAQIGEIKAALDLGKSQEEIRTHFHLSEAALKLLNEQLKDHTTQAGRAAAADKQHQAAIQQLVDSLSHEDLTRKANDLAEALAVLERSGKATPEILKQVADEAADIIVKGGHVPQYLQDLALRLGAIHDPALAFETDWKNIGKVLDNEITPAFQQTLKRLDEIFSANRTGFGEDLFKNIGRQLEQEAPPAVDALGQIIGNELPKFISDAVSQGWSQGVTHAMNDLGAQLGGHLFGNLQKPITSGLSQVLGDSMSAAIGIALPVIGEALFSGLSQLLTDPKTGHGWLHEILWGREGRNEVEDFVTQVYGSFDALHQQLLALGAEGERLWIQLTQGVGRRDTKAADAAIQAIQNALPSALTQAAGYQTVAQLKDAAAKAVKVWEYMRDSGQYTADEIADAFEKAQKAIAKTGDTSFSTLQAQQDGIKKTIDDLDAQIQTLQQSISQEAPEEVMGVIEQQQRAKLAELQKQREDAQKQYDELAQHIGDSIADAIKDALKGPWSLEVSGQVKLTTDTKAPEPVPMADGGFGRVTRPTLFLAGEAGPEQYAFSGAGKTFPSLGDVGQLLAPPAFSMPSLTMPDLMQSIATRGGRSDAGTMSAPQAVHVNFEINAIDSQDVQRFVESRDFLSSLQRAIDRNMYGMGTRFRDTLNK